MCFKGKKSPVLLNNHMLQIVKIQILDDLENFKLSANSSSFFSLVGFV